MIAIAPTDLEWFNFLSMRLDIRLINFWTPTPWNIRKLQTGDKFYFMLKSPIRKIGGYGHFFYYENLTIKEAWNKLGIGNGVRNLVELAKRTSQYGKQSGSLNTEIGCIVLADPVWLDEEDYFRPEDHDLSFSPYIVKLKYYPEVDSIVERFSNKSSDDFNLIREEKASYHFGKSKERKGQREFRERLLEVYNCRGSVTGESSFEVLEAAHIQPYVNEESNHLKNGITLRRDIHKLFDVGLLTVTKDYKVLVSPYLSSVSYKKYDNKEIYLPNNEIFHPSQKALEFHNSMVFRGYI